MIIDVKNMKGEKVQEVELPASIFEAPILVDLMHQAYVRQLANARVGTHETKTVTKLPAAAANLSSRRVPAGHVRAPSAPHNGRAAAVSILRICVTTPRLCLRKCAAPRCAPH